MIHPLSALRRVTAGRGSALIASLLLAGCNVATPPRLATVARPLPAPAAVRIDAARPMEADSSDPATEQFSSALASALAARGVTVSDSSDYALTVALSRRDAGLGVTRANEGDARTIPWLSIPRRHSIFDQCRAQRIEVVVSGNTLTKGENGYLARGGFDYCKLADADLKALAGQFADALVAR